MQWFLRRVCLLEDRFYDLVTAESPLAYRWGLAAVCALAVGTSATLFWTGTALNRDIVFDTIFLLDNAWRLQCGQRPHADFIEYVGITSHLPTWAGMWLSGNTCDAIRYGQALVAPLMIFWTWWAARRRFSAFASVLVAALTSGLCAATFALGFGSGWTDTICAMLYNRYYWALLCLIAILLYRRPGRAEPARHAAADGFAIGLALTLVLLGKINYAVVAVPLMLAGGLLYRRERAFWLTLVTAVVGGAAACAWFIRGDLAAYVGDVRLIAGVHRGDSLRRVAATRLPYCWKELLAPAFVLIVHLRRILADAGATAWRHWRNGVIFAFVLLALGFVANLANTQLYAIPLWSLAALMLADCFRFRGAADHQEPTENDAYRLRVCLAYAAATVATGGFVLADFGSVAYLAAWKVWRASSVPQDAHIETPSMRGMLLPPQRFSAGDIQRMKNLDYRDPRKKSCITAYEYALYVNDGLGTTPRPSGQEQSHLRAGMVQPLSLCLAAAPATACAVVLAGRNGP